MAIRNKKYIVRLGQEERESLRRLVRVGKAAARKITRARMLLKADVGTGGSGWTDQRIAETLEMGVRTVENLRRCCVEEGLERAGHGRPAPDRPWQRKLDGVGEAKFVALCCSEPPTGQARWTLELLGDALVALKHSMLLCSEPRSLARADSPVSRRIRQVKNRHTKTKSVVSASTRAANLL